VRWSAEWGADHSEKYLAAVRFVKDTLCSRSGLYLLISVSCLWLFKEVVQVKEPE